MGESDVTQLAYIKDAGDCFLNQRLHSPWPRVEQHRLVACQQILVERETAGDLADGRADPVYAIADFIDAGSSLLISDGHGFLHFSKSGNETVGRGAAACGLQASVGQRRGATCSL